MTYNDSDFRCSFCGGTYSDYCCDAAEVPDWLDEETIDGGDS